MQDPLFYLTIAASGLSAIVIIAVSMLKGWKAWLDLKHAELQHPERPPHAEDAAVSVGSRIEIADLKERIRKLEAIAAGVDL
ncbi:MAG: hypothetical protein ACSLE1_21915 [Sphingobium sp.]